MIRSGFLIGEILRLAFIDANPYIILYYSSHGTLARSNHSYLTTAITLREATSPLEPK